ncbi:hypothetical protein NECAME_01537 [Necator americanus]|uniref:Uncharacterized protein n=1 Tax=Necator americanus TaxID=51031 RepID=W2TSD6_NECAM|nr:hypothetical protein NECAME_01537 [Necator americanus]ETN84975.1 hypothetical protein NECAME_01537 [Necator americanus]
MTTTEPNAKTSPFLSLFHRKKRVNGTKSSDDLKAALGPPKEQSQSFDVLLEEDPAALVEALETIASEQPIVARSIPKHAKITKKEDKSMRNCLFEQEVYDSMLFDSLRVCDLLQTHLDECISSVRAKSPENCLDTSQDGRDSGRGASSASSTISSSPGTKRPLKSCIRADLVPGSALTVVVFNGRSLRSAIHSAFLPRFIFFLSISFSLRIFLIQ